MFQYILKTKKTYVTIFVLFISFFGIMLYAKAQDAQSYYQNGYQYFSQGDYQKAEENYRKAIDLDPSFENAHYWLGKVYRQTGQHDKAVMQWIEVLRINPRNPYAFRFLNESFRNISRVQNGSTDEYFSEGLQILKVSDESFLNEEDHHSHELLLAVPYFKKTIDLQTSFIAAYYWLAEIYQALSKKISWQYTSMAISHFEKVIQIEEEQNPYAFQRPSEYWYAYQELMKIYRSLGLNERRENLLSKLKEAKAAPYEQTLNQAGYSDLGYPERIEMIKQGEEVIELWIFEEREKIFRVVNKEIVGEEIFYETTYQNEEIIDEMESLNEEK